MHFTQLKLQNWRNFKRVDVELQQRVFLVGPNASGKSNLLDAFRFLRDVADPQGGFQRAVQEQRGGVSKLRSLHAGAYSSVVIEVELELDDGAPWRYLLKFNQDKQRRAFVEKEQVWHGKDCKLDRPSKDDLKDPDLRSQTAIEQVNANKDFRPLATALAQIRYLHLVPQLVREPDRSVGRKRDPFGGDFLEQLASMEKSQPKTFKSRMHRIEKALKVAVPQLNDIKLQRDVRGVPHLQGRYQHWRPKGGWQDETQLSDGTLRLLGLLWGLMDGTAPLLLEEPELSLHGSVIRYVPGMMSSVVRKSRRQVIVSTHSAAMLEDPSIGTSEVVLLAPTPKGTEVTLVERRSDIKALVDAGIPMGEAVIPRTAPSHPDQLPLLLGE